MTTFLFLASIYLAAAVIAVPLAVRFGLGSVLGYLLAGIVIGPLTGLVGTETQDLQHFAEFGVVMMLFIIGLDLEPRSLWAMRTRLVGLGGLQVVLTALAVFFVCIMFGLAPSVSIAIGMILALSSTAIVLQTMNEKNLMQTAGGRSAFSVLLMQDIAVIPMLLLLPLLPGAESASLGENGTIQRIVDKVKGEGGTTGKAATTGAEKAHEMTVSLLHQLPGWGVTLATLAAVALIVLAGMFLTRPVFRYIHHTRLREMHTALALTIVVSISSLMTLVGVSPALGAFLAGVMLASSEFRHQLASDIEPFKGLLLGLFFITVGAGINFHVLLADPLIVGAAVLGLIVLKIAILYVLSRVFGLRHRDQWLFTLGLAQAGEFGFVLTSFAAQQGVLTSYLSQRLLLIVALSMLVTPLLFIGYEMVSRRLGEARHAHESDIVDQTGTVIIAGIGRFGQIVNRLVQSAGLSSVVLDDDLSMVQLMRRFGFTGFYGDPTRPDLLHAAGLAEAKVLVAAMNDPAAVTRLVTYARHERPDIHIVARAFDRTHTYQLFQAGADDIVREMFDGALRAGRYVLENSGMSEFEAATAQKAFYDHDRASVRELARLWKPGISVGDNSEYVERARELERDMEAALQTQLEEAREKED